VSFADVFDAPIAADRDRVRGARAEAALARELDHRRSVVRAELRRRGERRRETWIAERAAIGAERRERVGLAPARRQRDEREGSRKEQVESRSQGRGPPL